MTPPTIEATVHLPAAATARRSGPSPELLPAGRVPRVARFLALAIKLETLVRDGAVENYAELARLGHVTRARVTQILNLLSLAPAIQEEVLFLPPTLRGRDPVILRDLLPIAAERDWKIQKKLWRELITKRRISFAN